MEDIIAALLEISRLDAGAMTPDVAAFRIDDLLRPLELDFAPLAEDKGIALDFVRSSLTVRSDRRLLRRLMQNLVSNAIKYTRSGRVLVGCRRRGNHLRIDVYDTGIGIPPHQQRAVFHEFTGSSRARGRRPASASACRSSNALPASSATPWASSPRPTVARVSVEVPLAPAAPQRAVGVEPRPDRALVGETVLCLDNDANILDGMATLLRGWGCEVLTATDLDGAIATASAHARMPKPGFSSTITSIAATASTPSRRCGRGSASTCRPR